MKQSFSLTYRDERALNLLENVNHKVAALWAKACSERVLHYFEERYPTDNRPRKALQTLQQWIDTGEFHMEVIRKASLTSHAAAREVGEDTPARSAARAAGQAVATAHVRTHAYGAAIYAQQAVFRATQPKEREKALKQERDWQYKKLLELQIGKLSQ